jgi:hypothetical protein
MKVEDRVRSAATVPQKLSPAAEQAMLSDLAGELHVAVRERWPAYYPARPGHGQPTITVTPRRCGFSVILRADLEFPQGPAAERLIVKIRREHRNGSFLRSDLSERTIALSRTEYDEHLAAYRFFDRKDGGLSVVRPIEFIEPFNAIVVEHASGSDLSKLVKGNSHLAGPAIRRCGEWWRLFHHELHEARFRGWDPGSIDEGLDRRLARLRVFGVPAATLEALHQEIRATARRVPHVEVPVSRVHGDCKLRHVWATVDGVQVLDFGNTKVGDSWTDPAALVVELSLYSLWTARMDAALKAAEMRTLLRAYFGGPPPAAFALYVVDCLLKKWHRRLRSWGPGGGLTRLRHSLRTAGLDKSVDRLYIDRWFSTQTRAWLAAADGTAPGWLQAVVN